MTIDIEALGAELNDPSQSLAKRMRALWALRDEGSEASAAQVEKALYDKSALLRHELCYVLGQLRLVVSVPRLQKVLEEDGDCMVRHEAAEAIGAIGSEDGIEVLNRYLHDPAPEVAETCQVSLDRIEWMKKNKDITQDQKFGTVDPAPADKARLPIDELRTRLMDASLPTFQRYRALFALRDINSDESVAAIVDALIHGEGSALFKHELAFVLGQMENETAAPALSKVLEDKSAHAMVRHEAAEALGSIAADDSLSLLQSYLTDNVDAVRESCEVAMDMHSYWSQFKAPKVGGDEE